MSEELKKEIMLSYIAGVFDIKGFFIITDTKRGKYAVCMNFTDRQKEIFEKVVDMLIELGIDAKIYKARRLKGNLREYQVYISKKLNVYKFLESILPYSNRKEEIEEVMHILETQGRGLDIPEE